MCVVLVDNLNLGSDESILKKNQKIIISGTRCEAVLTDRRLILAERETGTIRENIPYADITLAVAGLNSLREPTLKLAITRASGEERSIEIIFVYQAGGLNLQDLEASIVILRDRKVAVRGSAHRDATSLMSRVNAVSSSLAVTDEPAVRPAVPEMTIMGSASSRWQPPPDKARKKPYLIAIGVIVVIVAVVIAVSVISGPGNREAVTPVKPGSPQANATGTPVTTTLPVTTVIPATPAPIASPTEVPVPSNGTWVRISYAGNYAGTIRAEGRIIEVSSSGTTFYKVPAHDTLIEAAIGKLDGSAEKIEVGIYDRGTLVSKGETNKPSGIAEVHGMAGPAIGNSAVVPTPSPEIQVSPYASLPGASVPPEGVWVRVFYPGNFMGSLRANGDLKVVNSTGDQFYLLSMTNGTIDGSIEKQDGSVRDLIIEIYKNGALISRSSTSTPLGVVDIHTVV